MYNKKELYYKLEYMMLKKRWGGGGAIKIKLDFNKHHMKYDEIDIDNDIVIKSIFIKGYDYDLAVDVLLEAGAYRAKWLSVEFS